MKKKGFLIKLSKGSLAILLSVSTILLPFQVNAADTIDISKQKLYNVTDTTYTNFGGLA